MKSYTAIIEKREYAASITPIASGVILQLKYKSPSGRTKTIAQQKFKTAQNALLSLKRRYPDTVWNPVR